MNSTSPTELEFFESPVPSPDKAAEQTETEGQVASALQKLPPTQREVVLLKFQENLSYKEIGEITHLADVQKGDI